MTSGRPPFQGRISTSPPAPRIWSATQAAAVSTSPAWAGSAETEGIAISSASLARSSSYVAATGAQCIDAPPLETGAASRAAVLRHVPDAFRLCECAQLLQTL